MMGKPYSEEEMDALHWLALHQDEPLVKDASLPRDHARDPETGEGLDPSHGIFSYVPHGHRRLLMLDAFHDGWVELNVAREQVVPGGLTVEQLDTQVRVGRAARRLLPRQRQLLRMHHLEHLTERTIMAELGLSKTGVHQALERAERALARSIAATWNYPYNLMEEVTGTAGPVTPEAADVLARLFGNTPEDYEQWSDLTSVTD